MSRAREYLEALKAEHLEGQPHGLGKMEDLICAHCRRITEFTIAINKAEERDQVGAVAEDLAAHIDDALGYLTTMHESFQNHASDEAIQLLRDALEAAKKKSTVEKTKHGLDPDRQYLHDVGHDVGHDDGNIILDD